MFMFIGRSRHIYDSVLWKKKKKKKKRYLCIYVTVKKPNFPERFRADNEKNRNIPERNLSK